MLSSLVNSSAQDEETGLEEMFAIFTEEQIVISTLKRSRIASKSPAIMSVVFEKVVAVSHNYY